MATSRLLQRFTPLFDRILVSKPASTKQIGGIILPEKLQPKAFTSKVLAVGKGKRTSEGKYLPTIVQPGDEVLLPEDGGDELKLGEEEYLIFREEEILGIVGNNK
eukprot:TRINITY_DN989_c0_g1_i1.p1 TRINITY_DN989_c0_g1~~TRINITY_DN989_c0_g1_i1.p1  ORF type:complete len:105 (-),score=24.91 TRINITY_DN989_c0_g1_i1:67-381(-)